MAASPSEQIDWQIKLKSWPERISYMYQNEEFCDFKFIVGKERIIFPAHKLIFALSSSQFVKLFYAEDTSEMVLAHIDPVKFKEFLNFIYNGICLINVDNVLELLCLTKLFGIPSLHELCDCFLENCVNKSNVLTVFNYTNYHELPKFELKCLGLIAKHSNDLLLQPAFVEIEKKSLEKIVECELLTCKEFDLFNAVNNWSEVACKKHQIQTTPYNKRKQVGDLIDKIRFGTMSFEEFGKCSIGNALLTNREIVDIVKSLPNSSLNITKRVGQLTKYKCVRFPTGPSKTTFLSLASISFNISVNKPIWLYGYGIYGKTIQTIKTSLGNSSCCVTFSLVLDRQLLTNNIATVTFSGSENEYDLYFKTPIKLESSKIYTVQLSLAEDEKPNRYYCGFSGRTEICENGIDFKISGKQLPKFDTSNTGNIASLIFSHFH